MREGILARLIVGVKSKSGMVTPSDSYTIQVGAVIHVKFCS